MRGKLSGSERPLFCDILFGQGAAGEKRSGAEEAMAERVIFHIDVNSAFLSWEAVRRLEAARAARQGAVDGGADENEPETRRQQAADSGADESAPERGRRSAEGAGENAPELRQQAADSDAARVSDGAPPVLDLRTVPSAVGGDLATRHGVILAKSIPAKKYGVRTGEPVVDALRKCPELLLVRPDHALYREKSRQFIAVLRRYSPDIEQFSVDEAFADMTGTRALFGEPERAARRLADEIRDTLGFTVNVGISCNKLLAKMASDFEKPDRVHTLFPEEIERKMWPLPVRDLFLVGRSSQERLRALGIRTIGDLAHADPATLTRFFGKHGRVMWEFANGRDDSRLDTKQAENKGYGNSVTLAENVCDGAGAKRVLLALSEKVAGRLREDGVRAQAVSVTIRCADFTERSHQTVLTNATDITDELYRTACRLFDELWDGAPVRLLGVSTGRLSRGDEGRQLSLFDTTDYEKMERLDQAMDDIRRRFGKGAVRRASMMEKPNL